MKKVYLLSDASSEKFSYVIARSEVAAIAKAAEQLRIDKQEVVIIYSQKADKVDFALQEMREAREKCLIANTVSHAMMAIQNDLLRILKEGAKESTPDWFITKNLRELRSTVEELKHGRFPSGLRVTARMCINFAKITANYIDALIAKDYQESRKQRTRLEQFLTNIQPQFFNESERLQTRFLKTVDKAKKLDSTLQYDVPDAM